MIKRFFIWFVVGDLSETPDYFGEKNQSPMFICFMIAVIFFPVLLYLFNK
jgi:hypothetical protein